MATRPLTVLLEIVGGHPALPFSGQGIAEAYKAGTITVQETRLLQSHSKLSTRAQKDALRESRPVTDDQVDKMRAKLKRAGARLDAITQRREGGL